MQTQQTGAMADVFGPIVHSYTRREAVADGYLVDVWAAAGDGASGETVRDVIRQHFGRLAGPGFVCVTAAAWAMIERAVSSPKHCNDLAGVVHDLLYMSRRAVYVSARDGGPVAFRWILTGAGGRSSVPRHWTVAAGSENNLPGAGSTASLTFLLPGED